MKKKKLRLTDRSALRLLLWRLAAIERRLDEDCQCRPSGPGAQRPPNRPSGIDPPGDPPRESFAAWIFAGLLVLAVLTVMVLTDGSKGETRTMNFPFLFAAIIAAWAAGVQIYTFEVLIWPKLRDVEFPDTPFAAGNGVKNLFRRVWYFYTVSWVLTFGMLAFFTFAFTIPYASMIVYLAMGYWAVIVLTFFVVAAFNLRPGESYIKTMFFTIQWQVILVMIGLMFWGTRV